MTVSDNRDITTTLWHIYTVYKYSMKHDHPIINHLSDESPINEIWAVDR